MSSSKFEEFLTKVTSRVKSKEAHGMIKKELTHHLEELSQSYQKSKASKEEADEKAVQSMGNPFTIGENLNHLHRPRMDWVLISLFVIIAAISFLPLIGGVSELVVPITYFIQRQLLWFFLAVLVIIGFLFFDYRKLTNWWTFFYSSGLFLLVYTLLFGYMRNGSQRWISFGSIIIDLTPIILLLLFLAWAGIFNKINEFTSWPKQGLLFILFWTPIFFFMMLPHVVFCIIYFFCIITMFAFSQVHKRLALKLAVVNVATGVILITTVILTSRGGYLYNRLFAFINPEADPSGAGYIYIVVRDFLSQAGWFGNGFNDPKVGLLPAVHTDFAFPYLVYSLGWAFGIMLCIILLTFILRMAKNAFKTKDRYGRILVMGGAALFAVPACWNILMGFGILPIMGISLPFISYGGNMLLFYSAILGLILNVYRRKDIVEPTIVHLHSNRS
ncbi:FtsW/RodA/SpoVE family cell cycle protein [Alkalihalobacterium chitinilyticum]|uniref:FtsW/RodA/SpoVE family cell cycle protein n=1 Tax=Alkalihalobacterium chitinilyticum TaxID=2980103 RepID=A0ABT5VL14_9BACI|nr:FtsW/RodA/SpoVE family cell cycle protein [Alkalihalobacterium chitinilyticum]MDE5416121.1 FtsW/RodA/SpoVE family cell cycle protein [Alkalihalobacterium chitinilyticum]